MRVIIISPSQFLPHLISILNKNLEIATIIVMDLKFGQGTTSINGKIYNIRSYDYLKESLADFYYDYVLFTGSNDEIVLKHLKELQVPRKKFFY